MLIPNGINSKGSDTIVSTKLPTSPINDVNIEPRDVKVLARVSPILSIPFLFFYSLILYNKWIAPSINLLNIFGFFFLLLFFGVVLL